MTHYEILEIKNDATAEEIKRAYYKLVRKFPPERFADKFIDIREAYDILSNETKRKIYDEQLNRSDKVNKGLSSEAIAQIENVENDIKRAHTGKAVSGAEKLYQEYPNNINIVLLLSRAYSARGWKNKEYELLRLPDIYDKLNSKEDLSNYVNCVVRSEFSEEDTFFGVLHGINALKNKGVNNDIAICARLYADFIKYEKHINKDRLPKELDSPNKLLDYMNKLPASEINGEIAETVMSNLISGTLNKITHNLSAEEKIRLQLITEIINNNIDRKTIVKSGYAQILEGLEYMGISYKKGEPIRVGKQTGRNEPCPCGSGKKYKKCCGR